MYNYIKSQDFRYHPIKLAIPFLHPEDDLIPDRGQILKKDCVVRLYRAFH